MEETSSNANEIPEIPEGKIKTKKKFGKRLSKIPGNILLSPGGMVLIVFALVMEASDILIPGGALTFEIIPELILIVMLLVIAKVPLTSTLLPFIVERIPILSDIAPSWVIRLLF